MAIFVLVHGGWSGAHGFRKVRRLLAVEGHEVFTPSLTGVGERAHLLSAQVDLTTHIHDVVDVVLYEDLDEIVFVGFSYGGSAQHVHRQQRDQRVVAVGPEAGLHQQRAELVAINPRVRDSWSSFGRRTLVAGSHATMPSAWQYP